MVFDNVRQRAHHQKLLGSACLGGGHFGDERCEAGILTLREGRLDPAARVVQDADLGHILCTKTLSRFGEVELDDLGRAGPDEEQRFDIGAAIEQPLNHTVELILCINHTSKIALLHDGSRKAGLCKDHHASSRLQEVRAGPRAYDQEERILHLAVKPHDAGEPAENFALPAFAQDRPRGCIDGGRIAAGQSCRHIHAGTASGLACSCAPCNRAWRSFQRNCPALMT